MSLTQITTQVISANAISSATIANNVVLTRHIGTGQITADKFGSNINSVVATAGALNGTTANVGAVLGNLNSFANTANISIDTVQSNVNNVSSGLAGSNTNILNLQTGLTGSNTRISGAESNVISLQGGLTGSNTRLSGAQSNVLALQGGISGSNTRLAGTESNVIALQGGLSGSNTINTNQTTGLNGANTNITNLQAGLTGSNTRISGAESNVITLQTFATSTQSNIASILTGSSQFTSNVVMQKNLTVQGNLYVTGAQVDLGVGSTSIYDAILTLNANLSTSTPPPADSGILINRGNLDNVFIGTETTDPHIHFVYTNSPSNNTSIAVKEYIDIHANAFHSNASSLSQVAFGPFGDQNTGIHFPATGIVSITSNGTIMANVTSTGNLQLTTGYIQGSGTTFNSLDLRTSSMSNGVSLRSFTSIALLLDHNNNGPNNYFGIFTNTDDPSSSIDTAIFSIREEGSAVYSKGNLNYISSNATTDVYSGNAIISSKVYSSGIELRSNDYATYLVALGGLTGSNTRISGTESNVISLQGGITGSNVRISGNESNVISLQTGISGSNTRISGAESNVIALQGGLSGANANIYTTYTTLTSNDYITYTRLNANLNTVSSNTDSKLSLSGGTISGNIAMGAKHINNLADPIQAQDAATRSYVLSVAGGTTIAPAYTTNTSSGTSNAIVLSINVPLSISRTVVSLSGVFQTPNIDYVFNTSNNSIQYTVGSLPAGLTTVIQSWA